MRLAHRIVLGIAMLLWAAALVAQATTFPFRDAQLFRFRITDAAGRPVTRFATVHEKPMHLIVVRRDLAGYRHLHPTMAPDGTWSVALYLGGGGSWRAFADFTATGADGRPTPTTLGVDLTVAGDFVPQPPPPSAPRATVAGHTVAYEGTPRASVRQSLMFRVTGVSGAPVTLQPYLGSFGHLVVLREGDLGYLHVHPEAQLADGAVKFSVTAPGPGRYRMFFDFRVAGKVHTAAFTLTVS